MKIKIYMKSLTESHIIYLNDKKRDHILVDTAKSSFDVARFKFLVANMVSDWPNLLEDDSINDGLSYKIVIKDGEERTYEFKNKFPKDIYRLNNLITEICEEFSHDRKL